LRIKEQETRITLHEHDDDDDDDEHDNRRILLVTYVLRIIKHINIVGDKKNIRVSVTSIT